MHKNVPKWAVINNIKSEIKRRFATCDADERDSKLAQCVSFEKKWEPERTALGDRMQALRSHFETNYDESIKMLSVAQGISDSVAAFERDRRNATLPRPGADADSRMELNCLPIFKDLLEKIKHLA